MTRLGQNEPGNRKAHEESQGDRELDGQENGKLSQAVCQRVER